MSFDLQPSLSNELIRIEPLKETDFEKLYAVANDPLLWEQHPNPDRYKKEVFAVYFKGAMESGGAFIVYDKASGEVVGSSRFYDYNESEKTVLIGYTFVGRPFWGKGYNPAMKNLMIAHALKFVDSILFHVGALNVRSQKAMGKLGAVKISEELVEYYGEGKKLNFIYEIRS